MTEVPTCIDCDKMWAKPEPIYCCDKCGCYTCAECHEVDENTSKVYCSGCKQEIEERDWCEACEMYHHFSERCQYKEECEICETMLTIDTPIACISKGDEDKTLCQTCWDDNCKALREEGWVNSDDVEN